MKNRILSLLIFVSFTAISAFAAAPGALDPTFDLDGKVATSVAASSVANPREIIVQPDGKIIAVGSISSGFFVVRYNPNGSLDTTFDSDGIRLSTFGGTSSEAFGVALQSDGKIILVGEVVESGNRNFAVARLNPNGAFDTTFDTDGIVTTDFTGGTDSAYAVKLLPDGKIVVGGVTLGNDFAFARYNPNGSLDTTFDTDGKVTVNFGGSEFLYDMTVQPDGKIIGAGGTSVNNDYALCRLNTNGTLDTTFNVDGLVTTDIFANDDANSVVVLPDGKIMAGGESSSRQITSFVRYLSNGSLDTTFDGDGKVTNDFSFASNESTLSIKVQADGKILAGIETVLSGAAPNTGGLIVIRYNANGSLDTGFGTNGFTAVRAQANLREFPLSIEILHSGKVIVYGGTYNNTLISLARLNLDPIPTQSGDFDGDGFSDYAIFRPSTAEWFILRSLDSTVQIATFGATGDVPMDGDFDGDGRSDFAIYRPVPGEWWINRSTTGATIAFQFGLSSDRPVPGDYDKDGKTDVGIFRPSTGEWLILRSSSGGTTFFGFPFGANGDIPITRQ